MKGRRKASRRGRLGDPVGAEGLKGAFLKEHLASEMLGVCLAALRAFGVDPEKILKSRRVDFEAEGRAPCARKIYDNLQALAELATEWTENRRYLDKSGRPAVLPIRGKGVTFHKLVRKYFGARSLEKVLKLALHTRVVERVGSDRLAQLNTVVMVRGDPILVLARSVLSIRWMLEVAKQNGLRPSEEKAGLLPEIIACSLIPRDEAPKFAELLRPHLANFADMANRRLSKYSVRDQPRAADAALVGVHTYVFRD